MQQQDAGATARWQGFQIFANGAVNDCDYPGFYPAQVTPVRQSIANTLETIETPLWALVLGTLGLVATSLLIGFALGVGITVGAMSLMSNTALVLSYLTVSVSVGTASASLLCWQP